MTRRFSLLVRSPAAVVAAAVLLAGSAGWALAASSSNPVIRACANRKTGALRLGSRCHRNERHVSWNQIGPQGLRGLRGASGSRGATGATGGTGAQGLPGPGATSFTASLASGGKGPVATVGNGVTVTGGCQVAGVELRLVAGSSHLQASGTASNGSTVKPFDFNEVTESEVVTGPITADVDVIARDSTAGKFARIDAHAQQGPPCTFWGVITLSH